MVAAKTPAQAAKKTAIKAVRTASADATVEGVRISHPDRVIDASTGITKLEVVDYYLAAAKLILPHLVKRPVSLVRAPAPVLTTGVVKIVRCMGAEPRCLVVFFALSVAAAR